MTLKPRTGLEGEQPGGDGLAPGTGTADPVDVGGDPLGDATLLI